MAGTGTAVTTEGIARIVDQIVRRFRPTKVILFGSHAAGTAGPDSDVDLLVILDTDENPLHIAGTIAAAVDHPFAVDILVMTPAQIEGYLRERAAFPTRVLTEGRVLYEEGHGRMGRAG